MTIMMAVAERMGSVSYGFQWAQVGAMLFITGGYPSNEPVEDYENVIYICTLATSILMVAAYFIDQLNAMIAHFCSQY